GKVQSRKALAAPGENVYLLFTVCALVFWRWQARYAAGVPHTDEVQRARPMLTKKQSELLRFIHERLKETGVPPAFDEMKDALFLRSKSGIHRLILALEERGFIRRLPNRARALEVLRLPDSASPPETGRTKRFSPSVIEGNLGKVRAFAQA